MKPETYDPMVAFFDQVKVDNPGVSIEMTLKIDGETHEIVNTIAPVPTKKNSKETR